jgi:phosphatidylinositol alpha-1,6-mannosyltransferase
MVKMLLDLRRSSKFDLVHATSWRVALPAILLLMSTKLIISVHGREVFVVPFVLKPIMYFVFRCADYVIAVSKPILDSFSKKLPFKLASAGVAWNGVSFTSDAIDLVKNSDPMHIFCMCRLVERKNLVGAVHALAILHREGIDFSFHIAGSGDEHEAINAAIIEEDVGAKIKLVGRISDEEAVQEYQRAGIFLHPQIATEKGGDLEGFGIVIADAMIFGALAVAGNSGGPMDFIKSGETGFLVDGRDHNSIACVVRELLLDPKMQKNIAQNGYDFAKKELTWDEHCSTIFTLMNKT